MKKLLTIAICFLCHSAYAQSPAQFFQSMFSAAPREAAGGGAWTPVYNPWWTPIFSASNAPAPYNISVSIDEGASYTGWKSFDNVFSTWWSQPNKNLPIWLLFDCGETNYQTVRQLSWWNHNTAYGSMAVSLSNSIDGTTWTEVLNATSANSTVIMQAFEVPNPTPGRYFRFVTYAAYNTNYCYRDEIEMSSAMLLPAMTGNTNGAYIVTASSQQTDSYSPYQAFDRSRLKGWRSHLMAATNEPEWLKIDLGTARVVNHYSMWNVEPSSGPCSASLDGSNDDSNWTVLHSNNFANIHINPQICTFTNTTPYKWYRFYIYNTYSINVVCLGELRLYPFE